MALFTETHSRRQLRKPVLANLSHAFAVWRQRRALARLDAAALDDLGLTRAQAQAEAKRPLWDAPATWRV